MVSATWLVLSIIVLLAWLKVRKDRQLANPHRLPHPPGPPPLPLIGNIMDMPSSYQWLTYSKWAKQYGDIVHAKVLDKHIIVLNSLDATNDLFEKRSSKYSDRPRFPMVNELMGWTWSFSQMNYGPWWRRHRKEFHQYFHPAATANYHPTQTQAAWRMLQNLLDHPDNFTQIVRLALTSTIIQTVYGFEIQGPSNPTVINAEKLLAGLADAGIPGAFLVDTLPFLKYVPSWIPGAGFKRRARDLKNLVPDFVDKPFEDVQMRMGKGTAAQCVAVGLIERMNAKSGSKEEEIIARDVAAVAYAGGADTTVSTIQMFFATMALHPDVQRKAQEQLDEVVGEDRLPDFDDLDSLSYVHAIVKELLRWQPVTPLANVHCATENDEYKGYFIPKGSLVFGNAWLILHDEKVYPDPMSFRPERFLSPDKSLNPEVQDPLLAAFGFGRRICPGRHMAVDNALIIIASVLAAFDIKQALDDHGNPTLCEVKMSSGLLSYPLPFKCAITPRSSSAVKLVQRALVAQES